VRIMEKDYKKCAMLLKVLEDETRVKIILLICTVASISAVKKSINKRGVG